MNFARFQLQQVSKATRLAGLGQSLYNYSGGAFQKGMTRDDALYTKSQQHFWETHSQPSIPANSGPPRKAHGPFPPSTLDGPPAELLALHPSMTDNSLPGKA